MMETLLKFDINFFSVIMLTLILGVMWQRKDTMSYSSRLFRNLIVVNIFMLIMEVVSWQFNGKPGTFNWYANYISNMVFAWSTPLITCVWAMYIDYNMFGSSERLRKKLYYTQPMIINTFLILINLFTPIIFKVNDQNIYSRQPYMWLIVLVNFLTLVYICFLAYKNRSTIRKRIIYAIIIFVSLPALTAGFQVMLYGAFVMWPMMAMTLVGTYIYLETASTSFDHLTGLYSRMRIDEYIDYMISTQQAFDIIMVDLNDFKKINDNYGHHTGDQALILFSNVLSKVFSGEKMVSRLAGDEFLIVTGVLGATGAQAYKETLQNQVDLAVIQSGVDYDVAFSFGHCSIKDFQEPTYEILISCADEQMYREKALTKGKPLNCKLHKCQRDG
ncbi:GGDEF domain-containing protein [Fusibacter sp. JL216-2]|uniref:GGDEF domain-containing protein n=1 Tax=Fusibacter sp. JL216-2 TaxID=3071453 RepID=UPI003D339230